MSNPFRYFNSSPEVIRLVVMMYVRFPLSLRNVEDLLAERGVDISHETVRFWWNRFGPMFAAEIRKKRVAHLRHFPQWRWHLDEVFVKINGKLRYLWRAVDHEGEVLETVVTARRDKAGRFDQAISDAEQAIRLSPRDPQVGSRHVTLGDAEVGLGHLDAAIEEYHKAIDVGYRNRVVNMAGAYALQGKMEEAKSVLAEALRANPKLTVKMVTERFSIPPALAEGLRKAGLAEQ
jgi:tetratricopeptide (TPR) repeat protein